MESFDAHSLEKSIYIYFPFLWTEFINYLNTYLPFAFWGDKGGLGSMRYLEGKLVWPIQSVWGQECSCFLATVK